MSVYSISYDLNRPGQNYEGLIKAIEQSFAAHWHCQRSMWIVKSNRTAIQVRDLLLPHIDSNDSLFVSEVTGNCAWAGFSKAGSDWLKQAS